MDIIMGGYFFTKKVRKLFWLTQVMILTSIRLILISPHKAGTSPENLVKNICLLDEGDNLIVAIVKGEVRVSLAEIGKAFSIPPPRIATPEEIIEKASYAHVDGTRVYDSV
jgi:hypothetical protein